MRNLKRVIKKVVFINISVIALLLVSIGTTSMALTNEKDYENKIKNLKSKYSKENVQFLDGIVIKIGETLNLREYILDQVEGTIEEVKLEGENFINIEGHNLEGEKSGTTFISLKINNNVHIVEVLVRDNIDKQSNIEKESKINRSYKGQYKEYAKGIQDELIKKTGGYNRGLKTANFAVIRESNMPSALVECGFITNGNESSKLKTDSYQDKLATGMAVSMEEYLENNIELITEPGIFKDTKNHWAKEEIKSFVDKGYVLGYEDGEFKPDKGITRAEFIKVVNKVFKFREQGKENYLDVGSDDWYYHEVNRAVKAGYIDTESKNFRPYDSITREEAAAIITTIKKNKDTNLDKLEIYKDKDKVSEWAKTSVEGAIEAKYMGREGNIFRPKDRVTRAETVSMLGSIK